MRVALATYTELPGLSEDDRTLLAPLQELGVQGVPTVWDDPRVRWSEFDAVVLRSTWDYHRKTEAFLRWIGTTAAERPLWNSAAVVRWNAHKGYLKQMEADGVRVVPTVLCPDLAAALATIQERGWPAAVVKGAVSAGGFRTYRVERGRPPAGTAPWESEPPLGELLVQPYLAEVERSGERSIVLIEGEYSHAFRRAPRLATRPGWAEGSPWTASDAEIALARRAVRSAPGRTLYARVDMVPDDEGQLCLMELEVIEPALELRTASGAATRLARAIAERCREGRR